MKHFPAGDALFFVDGVPAGSSTFSLDTDNGGFADNSIYFGRDPLVTTEMKTAGQQSGREGFIDRKRTYTWDWEMTVANRHKRPINVRVEEPAPQSRDKEIVLEMQSKPEAKREESLDAARRRVNQVDGPISGGMEKGQGTRTFRRGNNGSCRGRGESGSFCTNSGKRRIGQSGFWAEKRGRKRNFWRIIRI